MNAQIQQSFFPSTNLDDNWIGLGSSPTAGDPLAYSALAAPGDGFASAYPALPATPAGTQQGGLLSQMMQMLQSMMGMLEQVLGGSAGQSEPPVSQPSFSSATISSTGDPHIAVDGTLADGSNVSLRYDDMQSDPDLVRSNSFAGGYDVSTQTTAPDANGVTYNQSATVTTDFGQNQVSFDNAGDATVLENGSSVAIGAGQTLDLGNGETVTDNGGSLVVNDTTAAGGTIATTMADDGNGVDVTVAANGVDLGGQAVRQALGES